MVGFEEYFSKTDYTGRVYTRTVSQFYSDFESRGSNFYSSINVTGANADIIGLKGNRLATIEIMDESSSKQVCTLRSITLYPKDSSNTRVISGGSTCRLAYCVYSETGIIFGFSSSDCDSGDVKRTSASRNFMLTTDNDGNSVIVCSSNNLSNVIIYSEADNNIGIHDYTFNPISSTDLVIRPFYCDDGTAIRYTPYAYYKHKGLNWYVNHEVLIIEGDTYISNGIWLLRGNSDNGGW